MTPAQEMKLAALKVRRIAEKATKPPWVDLDNGDRIIRDPDATQAECSDDPCGAGAPLEYVVDEPLQANPDNGAHIALWDPAVALLVAKVLDEWALIAELAPDEMHRVGGPETFALARAINRKES